ncbi:MAG: peptide ABC transporter substrate-binding protein [Clostridiales bacterium]|nr:peptide ABC transporter substrate-binding protein [Clostridiales bacterium]
MKKLFAILLALVTVFSFCACNPNDGPGVGGDVDAESLLSDAFIDPVNGWKVYDDLIAQIKAETDYAKRAELMHKAEDILMSNGCVIPLYYYNDIYMQKSYVENVYCNLFGYKFFHNVNMTNGEKTLRVNLASEPDFLDPALNSSVDGACLAVNSFAGLYTYDKDGKTVPDLATGYTVSEPAEDGSVTFTVTLKDGLKWSDGSALTAKDFEYSWKRAASEKTASDYGYMFSTFVGYPNDLSVSATNDTTLVFALTAPCAYIEGLMAFPTFFPVKQTAVESYDDWQTSPGGWCQEAGFISNGPFICTGWTHDQSMIYEKNPYYHNADKVTIDKLTFMLSADDTAIYNAYKANNVDFIDSVPTDAIKELKNNPEFKIIDNLGTYYVAFNANSDLFKGKTAAEAACMRLAFNILIDRDYICESVGQTGQIAANSYIPVGMKDGNGGIFKPTAADNAYFDDKAINEKPEETLDLARKYLMAAGFKFDAEGKLSSETPIVIEYLTNDGTGHVAAAQSMQTDFKEIGIEMTIQQVEWNTFLQERKQGNFDIAREGWLADFDDPINMLEMFTTDSGNNDCQFGRNQAWKDAQAK